MTLIPHVRWDWHCWWSWFLANEWLVFDIKCPILNTNQIYPAKMKTKRVKQRPGTQGLTDVQKLFFFLCELLSKSRIHESKKEPWFTLPALGGYIWQKDLKFWSSSFKNVASEMNYFHYIAASELLHRNYSFWTSARCATQLSRAIRRGEHGGVPCRSLSGSESYRLLSDCCLFFCIDHLPGKWKGN